MWLIVTGPGLVNSTNKHFTGKKDDNFSPFSSETETEKEKSDFSHHLGNNMLFIHFVKSPLTVTPAMSANGQLYLQGEDRMNAVDNAGVSQKNEAMD